MEKHYIIINLYTILGWVIQPISVFFGMVFGIGFTTYRVTSTSPNWLETQRACLRWWLLNTKVVAGWVDVSIYGKNQRERCLPNQGSTLWTKKNREASYDFVTNKSSLTSPKWEIFLDTVCSLLGIPQSNSHHSDVATAIWSWKKSSKDYPGVIPFCVCIPWLTL